MSERYGGGDRSRQSTVQDPDGNFLTTGEVIDLLNNLTTERDRLLKLPEWVIRTLKTLGEYYELPTDGRDIVSEIQGWMHVLCFHYIQNRRDVKEYDQARRDAKKANEERDGLKQEVLALRANVTRCCFCMEPTPDLAALKAHSAKCQKHPLAVERDRITQEVRDAIDGLTKRLADSVSLARRLGEALTQCRDRCCGRQPVGERMSGPDLAALEVADSALAEARAVGLLPKEVPMEKPENKHLADEFAEKGTLKHLLLRLGFMPDNEEVAEAIIKNIVEENEKLASELPKFCKHCGRMFTS